MEEKGNYSADSKQVAEEKRKVISYRGYENRFELITKDTLSKFKRKKIKKCWYNMSNKLCKKSFIYLGDVDVEKGDIVYVHVINGIASKEVADRKTINIEELFKDSVVFVGYMEDVELVKELKNVFTKMF